MAEYLEGLDHNIGGQNMGEFRIRYNVISYLRIVACLLVIRGHYFSIFSMPDIFGKFIITGAGPVTIFFVISGFLAYVSLDNQQVQVKDYYVRRIKKLVPSYYMILIACIIFFMITNESMYDSMKIGWLRYFSFLNMIIPSFCFDKWNNLYGFWTMGCFPLFYLLAPYLYRKMQNVKSSIIIFLLAVFAMIVGSEIIGYILQAMQFDGVNGFVSTSPISTLYLFVLGMMSAFAYKRDYVGKMAMFFGIFLLGMLASGKSGYVLWGGVTSIIVMIPSVDLKIEKNKFWNWIVLFLDRNSFNIYLLHLLISDICIWIMKSTSFFVCIIAFVIVLFSAELLSRILKILDRKLNFLKA